MWWWAIDWPYSIRLSAAERRAPFGRPRYQSDPSSVAKCERGDAGGAIRPYQALLRVRVQPVLQRYSSVKVSNPVHIVVR